jgi:hypothetical protein
MASHNYLNVQKPGQKKTFINKLPGEFHLLWCTSPRVDLFGCITVILYNAINIILYVHCIPEIVVYRNLKSTLHYMHMFKTTWHHFRKTLQSQPATWVHAMEKNWIDCTHYTVSCTVLPSRQQHSNCYNCKVPAP